MLEERQFFRHVSTRGRPSIHVTFFSLIFVTLLTVSAGSAESASVSPLFDLTSPERSPFPSDFFTVPDARHNTGLRIDLPKPDCTTHVSDCREIDVINTLDGFNLTPRLSIPFSGSIDANTVTSQTVFLVHLVSSLASDAPAGQIVGINQVVWDTDTNTLHVEADDFLDQHARYALIVTDGVLDSFGNPLDKGEFGHFRRNLNFGQSKNKKTAEYRRALLEALDVSEAIGIPPPHVAVASVFTTQSITSVLEKIRDQIKATNPEPADFSLGPGGIRTLFPMGPVTGLVFNRHIGDNPSGPLFDQPGVNFTALKNLIPGAVGALAFGKYRSPEYRTAGRFIPPIGTRTGTLQAQGETDIYFNLYLPAGSQPIAGWPVAIFGHGSGSNKNFQPHAVAAKLASHGIATIAINVVGQGGGPLSTLTVNRTAANGGPVTFSAGGRSVDTDGDGAIDSTEGGEAAPPRGIIGQRDGLRQTIVDLMQLVRVIETGVDVDGDNTPDLDRSRVYYFGISQGGNLGSMFLTLEPAVQAAVLNVPGVTDIAARQGFRREGLIAGFGSRVPSLLNVDGTDFDENIPLRDQPPLINNIPGAMELQRVFDNREWVRQSGGAGAYARHLRVAPLDGIGAKPLIVQIARGDQDITNPASTVMIRAGDLASQTTFFRNDVAFSADPTLRKDPHLFMVRTAPTESASTRATALAAQEQIAVFFESDGEVVLDPDAALPQERSSLGLDPSFPAVFEVSIVPPLPEDFGFIQCAGGITPSENCL